MNKKYFLFGIRPQTWISAFVLVLASFSLHAMEPGQFTAMGPATSKRIALTFDDGPGPQTPEFLSLLKKYNVKATFFMLSEQVKNRKKVARQVAEEGHEIANHTSTHRNYLQYSKQVGEDKAKEDLILDMQQSRDIIEEQTGKKLSILRMPHGIDRPWIKEAAKKAGFILVNWTYGSDWVKMPEEEQTKQYVNSIKPGAIFLFHDGSSHREKSLRMTEAVIRSAQAQGYEIVTVGDLLGVR